MKNLVQDIQDSQMLVNYSTFKTYNQGMTIPKYITPWYYFE